MPALFWLLALVSVTAFTMSPIPAADTWWHLAAGREIWEQGRFLTHDPFSFTTGTAFWFNHEWLVEIIFYLLVKYGGLNTLYAARSLLVFAAFALVPALRHGRRTIVAALWPVAAMSLGQSSVFVDARAYLFTYLFLSLNLYFIYRYLDDERKVWLFSGALLTIPWANCHGAYILGPVVWGIAFVAQATTKQSTWKGCLGASIGGFFASLVNPYGYHIWLFPFSLWEHPVYKAHLNEWQRPDLAGVHAPYLILVVVSLALLYRGKATRWEWLVSIAFMSLGFVGWRHCTLAALILCHTVPAYLPQWEAQAQKGVRISVALVFLSVSGFTLFHRFGEGAETWSLRSSFFPLRVAGILNQHRELPKRIVNPFEWGGFLAWEVGPPFQTSMDGRAHTLFSDQSYLDSLTLQYGGTTKDVSYLEQKTRKEVLEDLNAELVLATKIQGKQTDWMNKQPDWQLLYEDQISALYLKKSEEVLKGVAQRIKEPSKALFYAERFRDSPLELLFLEKALETTPDRKEQVREIIRNRRAFHGL